MTDSIPTTDRNQLRIHRLRERGKVMFEDWKTDPLAENRYEPDHIGTIRQDRYIEEREKRAFLAGYFAIIREETGAATDYDL